MNKKELHEENVLMRNVLNAILKYDSEEVYKDGFAYDRMVESYRDAARAGLKIKKEVEDVD